MDTQSTEQDLRREAIRRRLSGEQRCDICRDLNHSPRWFSKWWAAYQQNPRTDFANRSRVPHTSPAEIPEAVAHTIVSIRQTLEAAATTARAGMASCGGFNEGESWTRVLNPSTLTPSSTCCDAIWEQWLRSWAKSRRKRSPAEQT